MLKTPIACAYHLGQRKLLNLQCPFLRPAAGRKKDWHERKSDSLSVLMVLKVGDSQMITSISLVEQTINGPVVLAS